MQIEEIIEALMMLPDRTSAKKLADYMEKIRNSNFERTISLDADDIQRLIGGEIIQIGDIAIYPISKQKP